MRNIRTYNKDFYNGIVSIKKCINRSMYQQGMYQRNVLSNERIEPGYQTYHEIIHGFHRNYIHTYSSDKFRIIEFIIHTEDQHQTVRLRGVGRISTARVF